MTTAHKYLKDARAPGRRHIFYLQNSKCILSNSFGLERKMATLCIYKDSRRKDSDVTYCTPSQQIFSHFEKDKDELK